MDGFCDGRSARVSRNHNAAAFTPISWQGEPAGRAHESAPQPLHLSGHVDADTPSREKRGTTMDGGLATTLGAGGFWTASGAVFAHQMRNGRFDMAKKVHQDMDPAASNPRWWIKIGSVTAVGVLWLAGGIGYLLDKAWGLPLVKVALVSFLVEQLIPRLAVRGGLGLAAPGRAADGDHAHRRDVDSWQCGSEPAAVGLVCRALLTLTPTSGPASRRATWRAGRRQR